MAKVLKKAGHKVDWQVSPQAALSRADAQPPDAIVLDIMLAGHSGIEFLYEFRSYPDWQSLPIVIYGSLSPEEVRESLSGFDNLNINDYLYKPTTPLSEIADSLERALQLA